MTNIYFELNPSLPFLNVEATKGFFYLQYPSGWSYWEIQDADGQKLKDGNYAFPQEVLAQWTTSDQVLIDKILEAAPWDIKPIPPPPALEPALEVIESSPEPVQEAAQPVVEAMQDAVSPSAEVSE